MSHPRGVPGGGGPPARIAEAFCHATSSVLALKIELYVPVTIPISSASTKPVIVEPPNSTSASSTNTTVSDVFSERVMVCTVERLMTWSKVSRGPKLQVLADAVEDDDGVVDGERHRGQDGGDEEGVDLAERW